QLGRIAPSAPNNGMKQLVMVVFKQAANTLLMFIGCCPPDASVWVIKVNGCTSTAKLESYGLSIQIFQLYLVFIFFIIIKRLFSFIHSFSCIWSNLHPNPTKYLF